MKKMKEDICFLDNGELRGLDQVEDAGQKFSLVDPDKELIYLAPASQQQGKSLFLCRFAG